MGRLEDEREREGTLEIFDALYFLSRAEEPAQAVEALARVREALERHPEHPAAARLGVLLGYRPTKAPTTLEDLVADLPLSGEDRDPLERLARHLKDVKEVRHLLEQRIEELIFRLERMDFTIRILAGTCVILALVALLGWAGALGWFHIPAPEEPTWPPGQTPEEGDGKSTGGKDRPGPAPKP